MKQIVIYISLWAGIFAVSCNKSTPEAPEGIPMSFGTAAVSRSANLLDTDNINTSGNQLTVYDLYTTSEQSVLYMDATSVTCDGNGNWTYSPLKYWTETGEHAFTAYLSQQGEITLDGTTSTTGYPTVTYDQTSNALSISQWEEITPKNQFDFLYAYHSRSMTGVDSPHRQVEFELNHLLCAVQFNVVNLMPSGTVTLTYFTLSGLHKGSAVIKQGTPAVTLDAVTYAFSADIAPGGQTLTFNQAHNLFPNATDEGYVLLWPHTTRDVFSTIFGTISYTYGSTTVSNRKIQLIDGGTTNWRAGQKYIYNFYIQDNRISLEVKVVPWKVDDVIIEE